MKTVFSSALRVICALFFCLRLVEGVNNTTVPENKTTLYTGWHKGPAERGTITIIWSCLTTVFACTWTILHLNVPYYLESTLTKILRKTKWMAITVIFPEFIFAKAICELQMAIEDLHELEKHKETFGWKVKYGRGCRVLYWLFHPNKASSSRPSPDVPASRFEDSGKIWTLTHSYFANMGGVVLKGEERDGWIDVSLTADVLVKWCVAGMQNPLRDLRLARDEILDKSKADNLLKAVAALQILWLIVSVITRMVYDLPISLLEVCTVAFAALAVATYAANLAKPKDVDVPVIFISHNDIPYIERQEILDLVGKSFFSGILRPTQQHGSRNEGFLRIKNDMLRLQVHGTQYVTLSCALAVSTMCFGAIHCAAWQSYFPSRAERTLWQIASVLSSTLPLSNLFVGIASTLALNKKAHEIISTLESLGKSVDRIPSKLTYEPDRHENTRRIKLWLSTGSLYMEKEAVAFSDIPIAPCVVHLLALADGVEKGSSSVSWCKQYFNILKRLNKDLSDTTYELELDTPVNISLVDKLRIEQSDLTESLISSRLAILNKSQETRSRLSREWQRLTRTVDMISLTFGCLSGVLYAIARIILLAVAVAAFRKQDERLYTDTWARFLPSIG